MQAIHESRFSLDGTVCCLMLQVTVVPITIFFFLGHSTSLQFATGSMFPFFFLLFQQLWFLLIAAYCCEDRMVYTLKPSITALFAPDNTFLVLQLLLLPLAVRCYCCLHNPLGKSARAMSCTHNRCVASLLANAVNQQGEDLEKNDDGDYSGKVDITTQNTSLAVGEACGAIF